MGFRTAVLLLTLGLLASAQTSALGTTFSSTEASTNADDSEKIKNVCPTVFCGAGRECTVLDDGSPTCVCKKACEPHHHPVCGTNDVTYENHCEMHRAACVQGVKISKNHDGACKTKAKEEAATEKDESSLEEKPLVCYQLERDSLRQLLIDWFKTKVEDEGWFYKGKNYTEVLIENFHACDKNQNNKLSAVEFLECVERNDTVRNHGKGAAGGSHAHIIRGLCVDALIIMSDEDSDWQLDLEEFRQCMDPVYSPPTKKCSLEDKMYIDGAEVNVDCNICVCACGNWVCTASSCKTDLKKIAGSYDHHSDQLPSAEERKAILEGFQATDDVDLSRLEEEINRHLDAVSDEDDFGPVPDAHLGRDSHPEDVEEFVANVNTQEQTTPAPTKQAHERNNHHHKRKHHRKH